MLLPLVCSYIPQYSPMSTVPFEFITFKSQDFGIHIFHTLCSTSKGMFVTLTFTLVSAAPHCGDFLMYESKANIYIYMQGSH